MQLAQLLRLSADTARDIASTRPDDIKEIFEIARQANDIADRLDAIARRTHGLN